MKLAILVAVLLLGQASAIYHSAEDVGVGSDLGLYSDIGSFSESSNSSFEVFGNSESYDKEGTNRAKYKFNSKLNLTLNSESGSRINESINATLRAKLLNGRFATIKIMPETASAVALTMMEAKCEENNCTVELKEVGSGNNTRAVYEVRGEKEARFLGLFKSKMKVKAELDAETGEVIRIKKP